MICKCSGVLSLFFVPLLAGCAFGTRTENLGPVPVDPPGGAMQARSTTVLLGPVLDARLEGNSVGCVRNGFYMKTAKVEATGDVAEWVRNLVANGLRQYGYDVLAEDTRSDRVTTGTVRVALELNKFYCDSYFRYVADVSISARVVHDTGDPTKKTYTGHAANTNWAASSSGYQETLHQAAQECLNQMIPDLVERIGSAP